jgi:hypothetical protein
MGCETEGMVLGSEGEGRRGCQLLFGGLESWKWIWEMEQGDRGEVVSGVRCC